MQDTCGITTCASDFESKVFQLTGQCRLFKDSLGLRIFKLRDPPLILLSLLEGCGEWEGLVIIPGASTRMGTAQIALKLSKLFFVRHKNRSLYSASRSCVALSLCSGSKLMF